MPRNIFCKKCGKRCSTSKSGYCRSHSFIIGKYKRTKENRKKMSFIQKTSPKRIEYYKSRQGVKRPEHAKFFKQWWREHPEEKEKARKRMFLRTSDKKYLERLSELMSGERNPNWRNGLFKKSYKGFYKKLKDQIRERDNHTCQLCGKTEEELNYTLSVNHIDFNKENSTPENLNALCKRCNSLINFDREKWTKYFYEKLQSQMEVDNKKSS